METLFEKTANLLHQLDTEVDTLDVSTPHRKRKKNDLRIQVQGLKDDLYHLRNTYSDYVKGPYIPPSDATA